MSTQVKLKSMRMSELLEALDSKPLKKATYPPATHQGPLYAEIERRLNDQLEDAAIVDLIPGTATQLAIEQGMSVALIVERDALAQTALGGTWLLHRAMTDLCVGPLDSPWKDQPIPCKPKDGLANRRYPALRECYHASAFLVMSDVVATARHCLTGRFLKDLRFVFDFAMINQRSHRLFRADDVYAPAHGQNAIEGTSDWALIRLDRHVKHRNPLPLLLSTEVSLKMGVTAIGHPFGLPAKYSFRSQVTATAARTFEANLRVYKGNSGCPVFAADRNGVVGIASLGEGESRAVKRTGDVCELLPTEPETAGAVTCVMLDDLVIALEELDCSK